MSTKSKPKTKEEWREERLKKAKQENGYILIRMELWNGEAFHALSKSEKLMVIECLAQLRYAPKGEKKRRNYKGLYKCSLGHLMNNGEFGLPTRYLQERGIKGEDTIARAKRKLVAVGFMDVVIPGCYSKAARFRYSDRWRTYNSGKLLNVAGDPVYDGALPGYCYNTNIINFNEKRKANRDNLRMNNYSVEYPIQLELFEYQSTSGRY